MKKMVLKLEELSVETLEMTASETLRGTVAGHAPTAGATCAATCYTCGINPDTTTTARGANPTAVNCTLCV
jgi:hypothetical protein